MRLSHFFILTLVATVAACSPPTTPSQAAGAVVRYSTEGAFNDVRDDIERAILAKGLVIDHTSHVARMLDRTRKDVGSDKVIYANGRGQAFVFCSAGLTRKMAEADAHNLVFCPYSIAVYSTAAEPKKVYAAYRRVALADGGVASQAALKEVDDLLDSIVSEALHRKADKK